MRRLFPLCVLLVGCGDIGLTATLDEDGAESLLTLAPEGQVRFDAAAPDGRVVNEEITFVSAGELPIYVADVWVESSTASVFSLGDVLPFPKNIEPGVEVAITVKFSPVAAGTYHGTLIAETGTDGTLIERALVGEGCTDTDHDGEC
jgi:hypothetical protein